ncbi:MFS transporter [Halorussus limi]|uniref:MFS transporter n=1 Tax=Halorussus limi TaxID=2938695 RepID=A0A8U0HXG9_9EURY|nr:MFS transporter [Halorussus limi]UPV75780.1 MFS transporter [Halorussus limi]
MSLRGVTTGKRDKNAAPAVGAVRRTGRPAPLPEPLSLGREYRRADVVSRLPVRPPGVRPRGLRRGGGAVRQRPRVGHRLRIVYPFATLYFYGEVGIAFTLVGTGLFANSVATAGGTLVGGYLSDQYGRKPVMVASMALSAPTLAAYALVTTAPGFITVAAAAGLAAGLFAPASQAMIADLTPDADREQAYGLLKVASNAGFGSGFVVGGVLYGFAHTAVFVADGLTSGVVAILLAVALPRVADDERAETGDSASNPGASLGATLREWSRAVTQPTILALAVLNVGFAVAYAQMQSTVPVFAEQAFGLTSEQLGTLYVLNPLVIVLFQLPVVSWIQSWRRTRGLALSACFWAASFVAIVLAHGAPFLLGVGLVGAFLVLRTVGEILHAPLITALASDVGTVEERGSQLSVLEVAKRLGFGIGPVVGGAFFDYGVEALLWPALVGMSLLLGVGVLSLERRVSPVANGRGDYAESERPQ